MPNEITTTVVLKYVNAPENIPVVQLAVGALSFTITGKNYVLATMTVPTTAGGTAIPVGNLADLGFAMFVNRDGANFVTIYDAVSGNKMMQIKPGMAVLIYFDPSITAPAAEADTADVEMQYMILEV